MKKIWCLAFLLVYFLPSTVQAFWYDVEGQPIPDTPYRKAIEEFGASLHLTNEEEDVFKRWDIPSQFFKVPTTETIEKGMAITPLIFFGGCTEDAQGNCNVIANFKIWQPDGKLYGDLPGLEVWVQKPGPPDKILGLAVQYVKIIIEPTDQIGKYNVDAEVIDLNKKAELHLHSTFTVVEPKNLSN